MNCPGANTSGSPARGSSSSVQVSAVSWRLATTSNGAGTIGAAAPTGDAQPIASCEHAVDVEQLQARGLQPLDA